LRQQLGSVLLHDAFDLPVALGCSLDLDLDLSDFVNEASRHGVVAGGLDAFDNFLAVGELNSDVVLLLFLKEFGLEEEHLLVDVLLSHLPLLHLLLGFLPRFLQQIPSLFVLLQFQVHTDIVAQVLSSLV